MIIKKIGARAIKDSRGKETIEVSVNGVKASSPSGKSTGAHETPSYRNSLAWNVEAISKISYTNEITCFNDLEDFEKHLCKIFKLARVQEFGANALVALELAILKALAKEQKVQLWQLIDDKARKLPVPVGNAIGGGLHSEGFEKHPTFQEFLLIPFGKTVREQIETMKTVYKELGKEIGAKKTNDEGAWQTGLGEEEILSLLRTYMDKVRIGIDVASSSFYNNKQYTYRTTKRPKKVQIAYMNHLIETYNIFYLEDPLDEEDFEGFSQIAKKNIIVGDDLTTTNIDRLKTAVKHKSINGIIIKPNQNGSIFALKELFAYCNEKKIATIISHRSGETMEDALADLAVGFGAQYIKCGIATPWRECKLKRLVEIEKQLRK